MGADLIIGALAIRQGKEPDWDAGIKFVKRTKLADLRSYSVDHLDDSELQDHFIDAIKELQRSYKEGWRDQTCLWFGQWDIWIAGGTSWGGADGLPTLSALMTLYDLPEILDAIGFSWPERKSLR